METIIPRNAPSSQAMTQDNEFKSPVYMPKPENLAGNESGVSNTAGMGTTAGQNLTGVEYSIKPPTTANSERTAYLNTTASPENRSAKFKNGEGGPAFNPGQYGDKQYQ